MTLLIERVREALENAGEYEYDGWSDEDVALDLLEYCSSVEDESFEDVTAAVWEVRRGW